MFKIEVNHCYVKKMSSSDLQKKLKVNIQPFQVLTNPDKKNKKTQCVPPPSTTNFESGLNRVWSNSFYEHSVSSIYFLIYFLKLSDGKYELLCC